MFVVDSDVGKLVRAEEVVVPRGLDVRAAHEVEAEEVILVNTEFEEGQLFEYEDLLQRVHDIIEAKHSGLGMKEKYTLQPPKVL